MAKKPFPIPPKGKGGKTPPPQVGGKKPNPFAKAMKG